MLEVYERMAQEMDKENYAEYLRLTRELQDREDARAKMNADAIRYLGDSIRDLCMQVSMIKQPTVVNLLITDPSDPKVKDFVDKISELKSQGKL